MRFCLSQMFAAGLLGFAASLSSAPVIQNPLLSPNRINVGDYVHVYFDVTDSGVPVLGVGYVEVRGKRICRAHATGVLGRHVCSFAIPHGGQFTHVIHFMPSAGTPITLSQTQLVGDLRIVRAKPAITPEGRASLLFAKLDYLDPGSAIQPTGNIMIAARSGAPSCTITLPQLTHCFLLFPSAGTYELIARYSGDGQFPALSSPIFLHSVAKERLIHRIPQDETPATQATPLLSERFERLTGSDALGLRAVGQNPGVFDYSVGTRIPGFGDVRGFLQPNSLINRALSTADSTFNTLRGFAIARTSNSGGQLVDGKFLINTTLALNPRDTNQRNDAYLLGPANSNVQWLTARADGSATALGVSDAEPGLDGFFFVSAENGIVAGDADNARDLFFVNPAALPPELPIIRYPLALTGNSGSIREVDAASQQLLITGGGLVVVDLQTGAFRQLVDEETFVAYATFTAAGDVLYQTRFPGSLVRVTRAGTLSTWPIPTGSENYTLNQVLANGEVQFLGVNTQLRLNLQTGVSRQVFNEYAGDEFLIRGGLLNFNASGDRLATSGFGGSQIVALPSTQSARLNLPADFFNLKLAPGFGQGAENIGFESSNAELMQGDTNSQSDVFYRNIQTGLTSRLSQTADAMQTTYATRLAALGSSFAVIDRPSSSGNPAILGGLQPLLISLRDNSPTPIAPPEALPIGFTPSKDASSGLWVSRDRQRAYFQRLVPLSAPIGISLPMITEPFVFKNVALSTDGSHAVLSVSRGDGFADQDWLFDLSSQAARLLKERTPAQSRYTLVHYTLARGADVALRSETIISDVFAVDFLSYFLVDIRTGVETPFPASTDAAVGVSAQQVQVGQMALSDDGSVLAWVYQSGNASPSPNAGLVWQRSPFAGVTTATTITRTVPSTPFVRQNYLVEAVVTHKGAAGTPSGIVRFDDGAGSQCDANLQPQGSVGLARCSLKSFQARSNDAGMPRISASYLGDSGFASSSAEFALAIARTTPALLRLSAVSVNAATFRVKADFQPRAELPLLGILRLSLQQSVNAERVDTQACDLTAAQLLESGGCEFIVNNPEANISVLGELIDANYTSELIWLSVNLRNALHSSGFE